MVEVHERNEDHANWSKLILEEPARDDRDVLVSGLEAALSAWEEWKRDKTLLAQYPPDVSILAPLTNAIEKCEVFKPIEGHSLFSGYSGVVLHAPRLALPLLYRVSRTDLGTAAIQDGVDWLIRVLETRQAPGVFNVAIWGLSLDVEVQITKDMALLPFDRLADSPMKRRLVERARTGWDGIVWTSDRYFDVPSAAIVRKISDFPYIGDPTTSFDRLGEIEADAQAPLAFLQACGAGRPLVAGSWFEYEDSDLDINADENYVKWFLPEIVPVVRSHVVVDSGILQRDTAALWSLPSDWLNDLLRSMKRFTLSQCRHQIVDRVLDLAIAFEIAVSGKGDNAPPSWKVGVRSAQLIGGELKERQLVRNKLKALYDLRNKGTHGGSLKESERQKQEITVNEATLIYSTLLASFLALGTLPDWPSLELEPRTRT
jgi:hypothetical protein